MLILVQSVREVKGTNKNTGLPYLGYAIKALMKDGDIYIVPERELFVKADKLYGVVPERGNVFDISFSFGSDRVDSVKILNDGPALFAKEFIQCFNLPIKN